MIELQADVAVVGSGFGGTLVALVADRIGLRPVVVDRASHPRFAIGESSTPLADLALAELSRTYGLPRLAPLAKYGSWRQAYPSVVCGLKRGFSYFQHEPGRSFTVRSDHGNELMVTASVDDPHGDTHWLRSDVDWFFAREVRAAGIPLLENTAVTLAPERSGWILSGDGPDGEVRIHARFVVDASGPNGLLARTLAIPQLDNPAATNSRALYGHYRDVRPWQEILRHAPSATDDHPFPCDRAALHHVLDEGWMWQLRFDNGVTSAGFVLDATEQPQAQVLDSAREWEQLLSRYPSIAAQFQQSTLIAPHGGLVRTPRLQRRAVRMAGETWALLPHTAGFVDPMHSTGIAQTLFAIERLALVLREHWEQPTLVAELQRYESQVQQEFDLIDQLVHGCYLARRQFTLFAAFSMLYFAAATTCEQRRLAGTSSAGAAFLCADQPALVQVVEKLSGQLKSLTSQKDISPAQIAEFEEAVATGIQPFNSAGLCDPAARNMYRRTAVTPF